MAMEFWGVEVKAGQPITVEPEVGTVVHLSQASLGEVEKDKGSAVLYVNIGDQKLVIGTLSPEKSPQISHDLVFEKTFTLSHTWKSGSVYFCGYRSIVDDDDSIEFDSEDDSEEEAPKLSLANGNKPEPKAELAKSNKANASKPESAAAKPKVKIEEPKTDDSSDEDDEDFDSDDSDEEMDALDEDDDEESSEEDEETPKKVESSKKRPAESATKTPAPEKKAKLVTPQKSGGDGKKGGGHTATPHPSKKGGKNAANDADKTKQQTPKSAGQISCKSCSKTFTSDVGLQSHTKAKHSGGK